MMESHSGSLQEVKKRVLQNNKLTPVLLGINSEGILRMDPKSKEVYRCNPPLLCMHPLQCT